MTKKNALEAVNPSKPEHDYEADEALRTIERYHEHRADPKLMERVKKKAGRKLKSLTALHNDIRSIDDLKKLHQKKYGPQAKCPGCGEMMVKGACPTCDKE